MARPLRIVCYAVNGAGLGHVTRLIAIARWLRRLETLVGGTPPEVVFLTSTEATSLLSDARFAAFKLPSKGVARAAGLDVLEHRRLAKHFVWQTLGVLAPDLLVVDTFPQGSFDELLPVLDGPFKKVLVLRDVRPEFGARPIFQAALRLYDEVIVPHVEGRAPDVARVLDRPASWVGDVLSVDAAPEDRAVLRAELGLRDEGVRLVYLSAGGGGDPGSEEALGSLVDALRDREDLHLLVGAGPLYRGRRLGGARLTWFTDPGVARFFSALDAAISAGGYNTVHELLHLGVPSAFFAQDKIADQQAERIARIADAGAALAVTDLTPAVIAQALTTLLSHGGALSARARALVPENGARFAAAHALSALPGRDRAIMLGAAELLSPRLVLALERLGPIGGQLLSLLGQLDPSPGASSPAARAALEPVLPQLSAEARAEVMEALRARSEAEGRRALEAAFIALVDAASAVDETALLPSLLEVALKKHPLAQEPDRALGRWAVALLDELARLFREPVGAWSVRDRVALYRAFPRLADGGVHDAFAAYRSVLGANPADGGVEPLQRRFQALKLQRRVTRQGLGPLLASRGEGVRPGGAGLRAGPEAEA